MTDDLIARLYGERCADHDDNCCVCVVWAMRDRIEALTAENERLRRDLDDLLTFAKAVQTWRSDADSYDRECDNPQRNYCDDVELMEGVADILVRRVTARAALEARHD